MDDSGSVPDARDTDRVDIAALPLRELIKSDDTALTNSLRRLVTEIERPSESFAAFSNTP